MLVRASGQLHPGLFLLTLGDTCHYALLSKENLSLIDPGISAHIPLLKQRLSHLSLDTSTLEYVFATHLDADRIGGYPLLKKEFPAIKLIGTPEMQVALQREEFISALYQENNKISEQFEIQVDTIEFEEYRSLMQIDRVVIPSEQIKLDQELNIRPLTAKGHTDHSVSYYLEPYEFLLVDEVLGYFNGRDLAGPGADISLSEALETIKSLENLPIAGLCFPDTGAITGALVSKHLTAMIQNVSDLRAECSKAHTDGVSDEEIRRSIKESFYTREMPCDPILLNNLEKSFESVWKQLIAERA